MSNNLNISSGAVELTIDNDPGRVIRFYPTDVEFAEGYFSLVAEFEKRQKEAERKLSEIRNGPGTEWEKIAQELEVSREVFNVIRSSIDRMFGPGTAQTVFGDRNNLAMVAKFFRGVTPFIREARLKEIERYTKSTGSEVME